MKFGALTDGLFMKKNCEGLAGYWNFIILIRWSITIAIMILYRNYNAIQMMVLLLISIIFQALIILGKPFVNSQRNKTILFVEIMISLYLYNLMCLTEFTNGLEHVGIRFILSIILIGLLCLTIIVNLYLLALSIFQKLCAYLKFKCCLQRIKINNL